jgi:hypothetical protein
MKHCRQQEHDTLGCPFCGSLRLDIVLGENWRIRCTDCEAEGPPSNACLEAVTEWNKRAENKLPAKA